MGKGRAQVELALAEPERLWRVIAAYLSTLRRAGGHLRAIEEWTEFLGGMSGTKEGAELFLKAGPEEAAAYAISLRDRPGMPERLRRPQGSQSAPMRRSGELGRGKVSTLAPNTITFKVRALKRVYRAVVNDGLRQTNPFAEIRGQKKDAHQKLPTEMIEFEKVSDVIAAARSQTDRALFSALFGGALRLNEARSLRLSDLHLDAGSPEVFLRETKDGSEAFQPISAEAAWELQRQAADRRAAGAGPEDFVFVTRYGPGKGREAVSESTVNRRFKRACRAAGVGVWATTHSARATTATMLLAAGHPIDHAQKFLRHRSITATQVYDKRRRHVETRLAEQVNFADLKRRIEESSRAPKAPRGP